MQKKDTGHKDRVNDAINFKKPDRVPRDFAAVPEIWQKLGGYFGTANRNQILEYLDVDCRVVSYDSFCQMPSINPDEVDVNASMERSSVGGMWRKVAPDGTNRDIWGAHRRKVPSQFGAYDELASFPLENANSVDDLKRHNWPQPDWWNFKELRSVIETLNDKAIHNIRYRVGSVFETSWSLTGFEKFLIDLSMQPELPVFIMSRIADVHLANLRRVLDIAADLIDIVYFYDDLASQKGLLISPGSYKEHIQPFHQQIIDLAKSYGKPTMMHCCGSVYPLIETFIDLGLAILNPIQPLAKDMNPEKLVQAFTGRIAFHGGVDIQKLLPTGTPEQVKKQTKHIAEVLGKNGGYIMSASHHIQADTPLENVLAMYKII